MSEAVKKIKKWLVYFPHYHVNFLCSPLSPVQLIALAHGRLLINNFLISEWILSKSCEIFKENRYRTLRENGGSHNKRWDWGENGRFLKTYPSWCLWSIIGLRLKMLALLGSPFHLLSIVWTWWQTPEGTTWETGTVGSCVTVEGSQRKSAAGVCGCHFQSPVPFRSLGIPQLPLYNHFNV